MSATASVDSLSSIRQAAGRPDAYDRIVSIFKRGNEIRTMRICSREDLDLARTRKAEWVLRATETLEEVFSDHRAADEFNGWVGDVLPEFAGLEMFVEQFYAEMNHRVVRLKTIARKLEEYADSATKAQKVTPTAAHALRKIVTQTESDRKMPSQIELESFPQALSPVELEETIVPQGPIMSLSEPAAATRLILIVHGREDKSKIAVVEFFNKLDLQTIVLDSSSDNGNWLKQLDESRDGTFAVLLLTSEGHAEGAQPGLSDKQKQDLIFQLGFCVGRVGVNRVSILYSNGMNVLNDSLGVCAVPLDSAGGWQLQIARQMKRADVEIDLNKIC